DGLLEKVSAEVSQALYGTGTGVVGYIASGSGVTTTVQLEEGQASNFEAGEYVGLSDDDGATLRGAPAYAEVLAVDRANDVLTFTDLGTSISGAASGDAFVNRGNLNSVVTGLGGWLPASNPTSTPFWSVNRTVDPVRLAGSRVAAGGGEPLEEVIL